MVHHGLAAERRPQKTANHTAGKRHHKQNSGVAPLAITTQMNRWEVLLGSDEDVVQSRGIGCLKIAWSIGCATACRRRQVFGNELASSVFTEADEWMYSVWLLLSHPLLWVFSTQIRKLYVQASFKAARRRPNWQTNHAASPNDAGLAIDWQGALWAETQVL